MERGSEEEGFETEWEAKVLVNFEGNHVVQGGGMLVRNWLKSEVGAYLGDEVLNDKSLQESKGEAEGRWWEGEVEDNVTKEEKLEAGLVDGNT
jgi:hypothetical protein